MTLSLAAKGKEPDARGGETEVQLRRGSQRGRTGPARPAFTRRWPPQTRSHSAVTVGSEGPDPAPPGACAGVAPLLI